LRITLPDRAAVCVMPICVAERVELDLLVERVGVDGSGTDGDRLVGQVLHGDQCVGGLVGPAPVGVGGRVVGDTG
jgi:hypothetical protein